MHTNLISEHILCAARFLNNTRPLKFALHMGLELRRSGTTSGQQLYRPFIPILHAAAGRKSNNK
jgi:hypothetical protein